MICPYDLAVPGGVQGQVIGLSAALRSLGHDVDVIAPGDAPGTVNAGRSFGVRVNGSVAPMALQPMAAARTVRMLRRGLFDVVHLHEPFAPTITVAALIDHAAPTVGTFHASGARTPYRWFETPARRLAERLDARVAVSASAVQLARRYLAGTYEVLFNGIDTTEFRPTAGGAERLSRTIVFIGRHEPRKGLEVLLDAMAMLPGEVELLVIGDGPEHDRLRARSATEPRIRWLGQVCERDKIDHLAGATVLCAPSIEGESFGVVLLEAMALGTPVVASDIAGYRGPAADGRAAVLVAPGDPTALASALRRVIEDRSLARNLAVAGRRRAEDFSMNALAVDYQAIYQRIT